MIKKLYVISVYDYVNMLEEELSKDLYKGSTNTKVIAKNKWKI